MKKQIISALMLTTLIIISFSASVSAYTIDGDLSDWGLGALETDAWNINETWVPNAGVMYVVEDNHNPNHGGVTGIHIKGIGSSYSFYDEPKLLRCNTTYYVSEPYGEEPYDLEAMYFDQDSDNFYVAIVTSLVPTATGWQRQGDLAMNLDNNLTTGDYGYEYGVRIHEDSEQGKIIKDPIWDAVGYLCPVGPDVIKDGTGTYSGDAEIAYTKSWLTKTDNGYDNYVIEMSVNKSDVGVSGPVSFSSLRVTDNCINDHISYVPEFPGIAITLALIVGLIFSVYLVQNRRRKE